MNRGTPGLVFFYLDNYSNVLQQNVHPHLKREHGPVMNKHQSSACMITSPPPSLPTSGTTKAMQLQGAV